MQPSLLLSVRSFGQNVNMWNLFLTHQNLTEDFRRPSAAYYEAART